VKREVTPEFVNMSKEILYPQIQGVTNRPGGGLAAQLAHQVAAGGASEERTDDFRVGDVGQLGALLRESPDVVPKRLSRLLSAASEVPGIPGAHVRALEIVGESLD
jgi:hypothetical protein